MQSFIKTRKIAACLAISMVGALCQAQTGPGPSAEKNAIGSEERVVPKSVFDAKAAAHIWNIKPGKDETTASMERRVEKMLRRMIKDSDKLDYDTSYWRLLAFLREVPLDKMSESRKAWYFKKMPNPRLTDEQRDYILEKLKNKPLYKMTPKEIDLYVGHMQKEEPDLRKRVIKLARQNLGQPYDIYLLGEFPYEVHDADPMFHLEKGDCVVFSEHMYAMALGHDWTSFFNWLQRIRYKDGVPGMTTRNHFTEADWNINNQWLVKDVTNELGATTVTQYREKIDRARFFRNFGIGQDIPVEILDDTYIPAEAIESVGKNLQDGDFINIVRGVGEGVWVGHVGLVAHNDKGEPTIIHSTEPKSVEQTIQSYVENNLKLNKVRREKGRAEFKGMKFLRLKAEDMEKMLSAGKTAADVVTPETPGADAVEEKSEDNKAAEAAPVDNPPADEETTSGETLS